MTSNQIEGFKMINKIIKAIKNQDDKVLKTVMIVLFIDTLIVLPLLGYAIVGMFIYGY
tara:strand:+ start:8391 stop:8564 length:174 start_codon:yes stop_codon:yes gene_type:complete